MDKKLCCMYCETIYFQLIPASLIMHVSITDCISSSVMFVTTFGGDVMVE